MVDVAWEIVEIALSDKPLSDRRRLLGQRLLGALHADSFISYVCDSTGPYADPVAVNFGQDRLHAYDVHYRHIDTLTPRMFEQQGATSITLSSGSRDEFQQDFLYRSGMHHGMNYFPHHAHVGSLDLRIWRSRSSGQFTAEDLRTLQAVGDLVHRLWDTEEPSTQASLTPRELQVAELIARGYSDRAVCEALMISAPTLRTHLAHAFEKTGVRNRTGLAAFYIKNHQK
ncbi:MAG TPA: helix-turn-helix transcriptional regulator [Candidatus Agrococcus pullicola]|uniref:Helix-turn-helix transcriptional regulator n=1 Tax=Candidatus Agrococcus pullicola TaxID=2838429 RepID=A0A9D1YTT7_9MICO|nr:helix-turn-helix transcriptional regulator [Candidatus Agrococcus pullicola]